MARRRQAEHNYYIPEPAPKRRKHNKKKPPFKHITLIASLLFVIALLASIGNNTIPSDVVPSQPPAEQIVSFTQEPIDTPAPTPEPVPHIYDNAEIRDVYNGFGTEVIGKFSLIQAPSADCTVEALSDWYYNHVAANDYNWCMILYSDKTDNSGVYGISSLVQANVKFENDNFNQYSLGDSSSAIYYMPKDGTLVQF